MKNIFEARARTHLYEERHTDFAGEIRKLRGMILVHVTKLTGHEIVLIYQYQPMGIVMMSWEEGKEFVPKVASVPLRADTNY